MTQRSIKDPLARNLVLLRLIPRYPRSISTVELRDSLLAEGFDINLRSLQRDLSGKLSTLFQLVCSSEDCDEEVRRLRPYRWSFAAGVQSTVPVISPAAALAMTMAEEHLRHVLPPTVLALIDPHFCEARELLQTMDQNGLSQWSRRVRVVPPVKPLMPAVVEPQIWDDVATALLTGRVLKSLYLSRAKAQPIEMRLHPAGLAARGATTYLIARVGNFDDLRHFALHRFVEVGVTNEVADDRGFDMSSYLKSAAFSPRISEETMALNADVHPQLAWALAETPLALNQTLQPIEGSDWHRLQVEVPDDQEMVTWLLSQAERIRVLSPESMRVLVANRIREAAASYTTAFA